VDAKRWQKVKNLLLNIFLPSLGFRFLFFSFHRNLISTLALRHRSALAVAFSVIFMLIAANEIIISTRHAICDGRYSPILSAACH